MSKNFHLINILVLFTSGPLIVDKLLLQSRVGDLSASNESTPGKHNFDISDGYIDGQATSSTTMHETHRHQRQHGYVLQPGSQSGLLCSSHLTKCRTSEQENGMSFVKGESTSSDEPMEPKCSELAALKGGAKTKRH